MIGMRQRRILATFEDIRAFIVLPLGAGERVRTAGAPCAGGELLPRNATGKIQETDFRRMMSVLLRL